MFWVFGLLLLVWVLAWIGGNDPPDDDGGFHYGRDF